MEENPNMSLKFKNHSTFLLQGFYELLQQEAFVDVTLAAEGGSLMAHRLVLGASSKYFEEVLSEQPMDSQVTIILDNVSLNDLKRLIEYVYTGKVTVDGKQFPSFLEAAKVLQIKGLLNNAQCFEDNMGSLNNGMDQSKDASEIVSESANSTLASSGAGPVSVALEKEEEAQLERGSDNEQQLVAYRPLPMGFFKDEPLDSDEDRNESSLQGHPPLQQEGHEQNLIAYRPLPNGPYKEELDELIGEQQEENVGPISQAADDAPNIVKSFSDAFKIFLEEDEDEPFCGVQLEENFALVDSEAEDAPNIILSTTSPPDHLNIAPQLRSTKRKRTDEKLNYIASTSTAPMKDDFKGGKPVKTIPTKRVLRSNMKPSGGAPLARKYGKSSGKQRETTLTEENSDSESEDEETGTSNHFNSPEISSSDYSYDDDLIANTSNAAGPSQPMKKVNKKVSTKAAHPTEASEWPFKCPKCKKLYKREKHLNRHLTKECVKPRLSCSQCGYKCKYKYHLKRHLRNFHKVDVSQLEKYGLELPFICVKCGRTYERNDSLTRHLKYECEVVPQFSCPKCGIRTAHKSSLRKHLQFVHNADRSQLDKFKATALDRRPILPIKCEICGQNFKTKEDLLEHYNNSCGTDN